MKINVINNQSFGNKKFRIPVKMVKENTDPIVAGKQYHPNDVFEKGIFVKEYSNPKAKEYFYKALETTNLDEKFKYLEKMGDYKIIDISAEQKLNKFKEI